MSRNEQYANPNEYHFVTPRKGRVSRNPVVNALLLPVLVTPRKGRVSRNIIPHHFPYVNRVTPRKGRVSRNCDQPDPP